ncbi:TIGR01777 family oxidoreductase [Mucilaginibacter segetis]|uniref:TIGR01777 family oxidoreductase n=1 Tax=Mucilaginibacter segetis TaxID=2793071 RepID=A0A934PTQ9_9SPHI|nr:TIGR01777 family oxidoreductase [Mucilaginibacter segetis]MBK0378838.1 TIGR01777 family oxidoreductase [Mucilaginibacter segetis]
MKYKKIVLAGGNGYLGTVLAAYYKDLADEVIILSRKANPATANVKTVVWDGQTEGEWISALNGADMLINLCGKNVNCRYTPENRQQIISSRVVPTALLGDAINKISDPPELWINVTSATIYRHAEDHAQDEATGETGNGFSIEVCKKWEQAFFDVDTPATRQVALRMGIVLGRNDGVFPRLLNLVKLGMGGMQGDGEQYVAWIHELDAAQITEYIYRHRELNGVINCTSPNAVKNKELMGIIRKAYGVPFGLPAPQWLLEIGARLIVTETELILKSRWVAPKRLLEAGYQFRFPLTQHAIHDILSTRV